MASFVLNHHDPYEALSKFIAQKPLSGKTVFITGAGRGVGDHIARAIAEAGAKRIGILGRDKARIEGAQEKLSKKYPSTVFVAYAATITDEDAIAAVFDDFGFADILINNAGVFGGNGLFVKQDLKQWFTAFEVNVLGTAVVTQKYLQAKGAETPAIVLNCSSLAAHMRFPLHGWSGYNSSKLAQARIFEMLRFEHPETRFISIHPGSIDTDGYASTGTTDPAYTSGTLAGQFFAWAATDEADFLRGRFVWAEWDIDELKSKKDDILEDDLLLVTFDGLSKGF